MDIHRIDAICEMASALHQYNRGVLSMMGLRDLAVAHEMASRTIEDLREQRDRLIPKSDSLFDLIDEARWPPEAVALQERIDAAARRRDSAWKPIQALIDEARRLRDAGYPLC